MSLDDGVEPGGSPRGSAARNVLGGIVAVGVVIAVFGFLIPKFASYRDVWQALQTLDVIDIAVMLALTVLYLIAFWWVNMAALPGLGFWQGGVATLTPNAVACTLPAGPPIALALQADILHSWGFASEAIATMIAVGGVWNVLGKYLVPVFALVLLVIAGEATRTAVLITLLAVIVLAIALGVFGLILWKESLARRIGGFLSRVASAVLRPLKKGPVDLTDEVLSFRDQTVSVARRRWLPLTGASLVNQITAFLILLVALRALGVTQAEMHWTEAFAAFAIARVVSSIPITPGAVGIAEASFVTAFVAVGAPRTESVAAVMLFRFLTWLLPIPLGALTFVVWRRKKSWRKPRPESQALSDPMHGAPS